MTELFRKLHTAFLESALGVVAPGAVVEHAPSAATGAFESMSAADTPSAVIVFGTGAFESMSAADTPSAVIVFATGAFESRGATRIDPGFQDHNLAQCRRHLVADRIGFRGPPRARNCPSMPPGDIKGAS